MPIFEYKCRECGERHDELTYTPPKAKVKCGVDGCEGIADKLEINPFSSPGLSDKSGNKTSGGSDKCGKCPIPYFLTSARMLRNGPFSDN